MGAKSVGIGLEYEVGLIDRIVTHPVQFHKFLLHALCSNNTLLEPLLTNFL